jgi:hypothetical protein
MYNKCVTLIQLWQYFHNHKTENVVYNFGYTHKN